MGAKEIVEQFSDPMFRDRFTRELSREEQFGIEQEALGMILTDPSVSQQLSENPERTLRAVNDFARTLPIPVGQFGIQEPPSGEAVIMPGMDPERGGFIGFLTNLIDPGVLLDPFNLVLGGAAGSVAAGQAGRSVVRGGTVGVIQEAALPATAGVTAVQGMRLLLRNLARKPSATETLERETLASTVAESQVPDAHPAVKVALADDVDAKLMEERLSLGPQKKLNAAAEELFKSRNLTLDPERPLYTQIMDQIEQGNLKVTDFEKFGVSQQEFLDTLYAPTVQFAARTLQDLSRLKKALRLAGLDTPAMRNALDSVADEIDGQQTMGSLWRRLDNIRRGLLVTQMSTAIRNFETQMGRLGLDVLQAPLDASLQRLMGFSATKHPLDGLEVLFTVFQRGTKQDAELVLKAFPDARDRLFLRYSSDIVSRAERAGVKVPSHLKGLEGAERVVELLNTFNRFQEFVTRRGVFQATLSQRLRDRGMDLEEMIRTNQVGAIPDEEIRASVEKALEVTFAQTPEFGTVGRAFVDFVNKFPGATLPIPFPRFMVNSLKFLWDYNPTGMLSLLRKGEREALANGDVGKISKAILGSGMLLTAWQIRNSDAAKGTRWYEIKNDEGEIINLLAFNPFASYLFIADTVKRQKDGTLFELGTKDIALGVLASNLRAGTGLFILDQFLEGVTSIGDTEKAKQRMQELAGEVIGGLAVPFGTIKDVIDQFENNPRVRRDRREEPLLGPLKQRIPGLEETLPVQPSPLRAEPVATPDPGIKQATGITKRTPQNLVEDEVNRLQIPFRRLFPRSDLPEVDRLVAAEMGPTVQADLVPVLASPVYQSLRPEVQRLIIIERVKQLRGQARKTVRDRLMKTDPKLAAKMQLETAIDNDLMRILRGMEINVEEAVGE